MNKIAAIGLALLLVVVWAVLRGFGQSLGQRLEEYITSAISIIIPKGFPSSTTTSEADFLRNEEDYYKENYRKIAHLFYYDQDDNTVLKTPNKNTISIVERDILLYIISRFLAARFREAKTHRVTLKEVQESVPIGSHGERVVRNSYTSFNQFLTEDSFGSKFVEGDDEILKDSEFELDKDQLDGAIEWILEKEEYQL